MGTLIVVGLLLAAPEPALVNGDFATGEPAPWEVRYARKASDEASRPRWTVTVADGHVLIGQDRQAAGSVYLGQRLACPRPLPAWELTFDYQTFCAQADRSGSLTLRGLTPEAWDALDREPGAGLPVDEGVLFSRTIHPNRQDQTTWTTATVDLSEATELAGRTIVLAVEFNAWHPADEEWARLGRFRLGPPRPRLLPLAWPTGAMANEPLTLTVRPRGAEGLIELVWRSGERTGRVRAEADDDGRYTATLPAAALTGPVTVWAELTRPGAEPLTTPEVELNVTRRPAHPSLYYTLDELAAMRAKLDRFEWARTTFANLRRNADAWLGDAEPPTRQGGWSHNYTCPADGARLQFRADHPTEHLCPRCGKITTGEKYDDCWAGNQHGRFINAAQDLALTWRLTGERRYGDRAVAILDWYATHYADFPLGKGPAGKGRIMSQSLTECTALIGLIRAADLVDELFSPAQRRRIEQDLIRAGAEHVRQFTFGIHNIQCWHNACVGAAGYYLGDQTLIDWALHGSLGFDQQVAKGIMPDGMWYERSLGYHGYTLNAFLALVIPAWHHGLDLRRAGHLPRMFTLPLRLAWPNFVPPSLNDQGYSSGRIATEPLEYAVAWYGDPVALSALHELTEGGVKRGTQAAWQFGDELPAAAAYAAPPSGDMPGAGLAILRAGAGEQAVCAMIEYGEHGGGHGHPDKLQLLLYGLGRVLAPDPGTVGYGNPLHGQWFKTTPAHNTVTVGEASQKATTGKLLFFDAGPPARVVAASDGAYEGYRLRRRLLLIDQLLVDVFDVIGQTPTTIDWFLRAPGELTVSLPTAPVTERPANATYRYLTDLRGATTDGDWTATWTLGEPRPGRYAVWLAASPGTQVHLADAPGLAGGDRYQTLRVRRRDATTRFVAVHQLVEGDHPPTRPTLVEGRLTCGDRHIEIPPAADEPLALR